MTAAAGATDPNPGNNSATDTDTLTPQTDLAITKTDGAASEVPGTPVTYTIVVTNAGPSNAAGATVADTFPAAISGVNWTCVAAGGASCAAGGSGNINDTVNVPVGGSVTYTATGNISASATGTLVNTATVTAAAGATDPNPGNNSATDTDTLAAEADLEITKEDSADPPPAGQDLIYTLTVENLGPSDALNVVVSDALPSEVTYVSDDCGGTNTPPWTWNVGTLADGATVTCNITVSINPTPPASISNTATVDSDTTDPVSGNDSDTEETQLDAIPPQVDNVDSVAGTGDGELTECETANVEVSQLLVTFSEEMNDPPGDTDPGDVTNPASYLLVKPGPDFQFATTGCTGVAGDDVAVTITSVTYDSGTDTATLHLAGDLADAQHRLYACASLTDLAGNPLDGDGSRGPVGTDFVRGFRVDADNLLANGHFDCNLLSWTEIEPTSGEVEWDGDDADTAVTSGSTEVVNLMPGLDTSFGLSQCVPVPGSTKLDLSSRVRLTAGAGVSLSFVRSCQFFSSAACTGSLGGPSDAFLLSDTGGTWLTFARQVDSAAGAASVRCEFRFATPTGVSFDGAIDQLFLGLTGEIFSDGFETGDTSQWTQCVGLGCPP